MVRLIRRLIAVWKLRKAKFEFCRECGIPLTESERGWWCIDCTQDRITNPPLDPTGMEEAYKNYNKQQYLRDKYLKEQNQLHGLLAQQHTPTLEEQQRMAAQQQNTQAIAQQNLRNQLGSQLGNALGGLFGRGPFS